MQFLCDMFAQRWEEAFEKTEEDLFPYSPPDSLQSSGRRARERRAGRGRARKKMRERPPGWRTHGVETIVRDLGGNERAAYGAMGKRLVTNVTRVALLRTCLARIIHVGFYCNSQRSGEGYRPAGCSKMLTSSFVKRSNPETNDASRDTLHGCRERRMGKGASRCARVGRVRKSTFSAACR